MVSPFGEIHGSQPSAFRRPILPSADVSLDPGIVVLLCWIVSVTSPFAAITANRPSQFQGRVRLVVDGGGFAPFLHDAVLQMEPGDEREVKVSPKDAFGECEWKPFVLSIISDLDG